MQQKTPTNNRRLVDGIVRRERPSQIPKTFSRTNPKKAVLYSGLKMLSVAFVAVTLLLGLGSVGSTVAYFNDSETSIGNRLQAGILGFNLSSAADFVGRLSALASVSENTPPPEYDEPVGVEQFDITVGEDDSSLPMVYTVTGELDPNNPPGCEMMNVSVDFGDYHFDGLFKDFVSPKIEEMGEWNFMVSLPTEGTGLESLAECRGKLVFRAGLGGVREDLTKTFSDEKVYSVELYNWEYVPVVDTPLVESIANSPEEGTLPEIPPEIPAEITIVEPVIQGEVQEEEGAPAETPEAETATEEVLPPQIPPSDTLTTVEEEPVAEEIVPEETTEEAPAEASQEEQV